MRITKSGNVKIDRVGHVLSVSCLCFSLGPTLGVSEFATALGPPSTMEKTDPAGPFATLVPPHF